MPLDWKSLDLSSGKSDDTSSTIDWRSLSTEPEKKSLTGQQIASSIDRYQAGLYGVGEAVTGSKWLKEKREQNEFLADVEAQRARELGAVDQWKDVHGIGDFGSYAKGLAIQSLPYAAEAIAGGALARGAMSGTRAALTAAKEAKDVAGIARAERALNLGSEVGGVAASYPSAVGDVLGNQREQSNGQTNLGVAAALAVPYAALNAVGVESALMKGNAFKNTVNLLDRGTGLSGAAARTAATATGVAFKEGASETGQEMLNQVGRMSVDPNEAFLSEAAQERFKESFIGGAALGGLAGGALGGWRRSSAGGNDISQAFVSKDTTQPNITTGQFTPPPAPAPAPPVAPTPNASQTITSPAVIGGTTDVAQAATGMTQAQFAEQQRQQQEQAEQIAREKTFQTLGAQYSPEDTGQLNIFGATLFDDAKIKVFGNTLAAKFNALPETAHTVADAIAQANELTGGKVIKVTLNAGNPVGAADIVMKALAKTADAYQIGHVANTQQAAKILETLSQTEKGAKLDQLNAIHYALTGENTTGFEAAQQPKGAKNGRLQLQTNAGIREVPVSGGPTENGAGGNGPVRPAEVQPVGATSVGEGPLGLQAGQPPAGGVRTSTTANAPANDGGQPTSQPQVSETPSEEAQPTKPKAKLGVPVRVKAASKQGAPSVQPTPAPAPKATQRQEAKLSPAEELWNDMDATDTPYASLTPALKQAWDRAVETKQATGDIQEQIADQAGDREQESKADRLIAGVLQMVIRPYGRLNEASAQKKREFFQAFWGGAKLDSLPEIAEAMEITPDQAAKWHAELPNFLEKNSAKIIAAATTVAESQGMTMRDLEQLLEGIEAKRQKKATTAAQVTGEEEEDTGQSTSATEEPVESDTTGEEEFGQDANDLIGSREEEGPTVETEAEAAPDLNIRTRKNISIQERYNAVETNNARILKTMEAIEKAKEDVEAGKTPKTPVEELEARLAVEMEYAKVLYDRNKLKGEFEAEAEQTKEEIAKDEKRLATEAAKKLKGKPNAVQVESTNAGNVRKPAGGGEEVGQANAEPKKPTRTRKVKVKVEAKPIEAKPVEEVEEIKTDAEKAADAWDAVVKDIPGAPTFVALTPDEQETFIEYGEENWTRADVVAELKKLNAAQPAETRLLRGMRMVRETTATDMDGVTAIYSERSLSDLEQVPGVGRAIASYRAAGMEHLFDAVDGWYTTFGNVNWDGAFTVLNGGTAIAFRTPSLSNEMLTEWTTHHELGHAVDQIQRTDGGVFSNEPEFNLSITTKGIIPRGNIVKAVFDDYVANPEGELARRLKYPFDTSTYKNMAPQEMREEVFAQLWAAYNTRDTREYLEDNLPEVVDYMESVYEAVKAKKFSSSREIQTQARTSAEVPAAQGIPQPRQVPFRASRTQEEVISGLPKPLQATTKTVVDTLMNSGKDALVNRNEDVKHILLAAGITEDVVNGATKYMPSAQDYLANQYERQGTRIEHEQRIQKIEEAFEKLPTELQGTGRGSVNEFIFDSTSDSKWGYVPSYNPNIKPDAVMAQRFNAMPAAAQRVIKMVFDHGYQSLRLKQQAVKDAADKEFSQRELDANGDQEQLNNIAADRSAWESKFDRLMNIKNDMPYAYLGRYGDYVAVAKSETYVDAEKLSAQGDLDATKWLEQNQSDANHYIVEFAETMAEAQNKAEQWKASGRYQQVYGAEKEVSEAFVGGSDLFMGITRLRNMLTRRIKNGELTIADQEVLTALNKTVSDLYLATVSEASAHRTAMQRKNISGADKDMMRNLATRGRADAHFLASLKHNGDITDAISNMRDEAKGDPTRARPYLNELLKRYANDINYKTPAPLARAMTRIGHTWFLSFNPAFYLQQMTQTYVLSLPYMAGRLGYHRSLRAINNAYKDIVGLVKDTNVNEHLDFSKAPADVRDMLLKLVRMGKIDIGIDADAVVYANERTLTSSVIRKLNGVNNRIEAVNRATAAVAAYRGYLQRYGANNTEAATKFAAETVSNTHGSYDGFNTPRILNSNVGKVVGQFKRFQIIQLSMLGKLIKNAFKGASAEERMVARRSLAFITSHMAVLGGALGVPFVSQIGNILLGIFGDDDEPKDLEYQLRQAIGDPELANLLLRGIPAYLGAESIGKKLAMENVASILPFTDVDLTSRSGAEKMLVGLMGPTAALGLKFADALGLVGKGEYYKALEQALPSGFANAMKAYRFANEGITMRNGDVVLSPEEVSMVDAAFQAVGLPTNTVTQRQYRQNVEKEFDKFYATKESDIKGDYVNASREGDSAAMAEARQAWQELQDARAKNGYTKQPMSDLFKAIVAAKKREASTVGGIETTKSNKQFVQRII